MTVGVYGLVAGIVKLDDAGLHLSRAAGAQAWQAFKRALGRGMLAAAPWLMKTLSVAGTAAMFLVGGGILTHGCAPLHHAIEALVQRAQAWGGAGLAALTPLLADAAGRYRFRRAGVAGGDCGAQVARCRRRLKAGRKRQAVPRMR